MKKTIMCLVAICALVLGFSANAGAQAREQNQVAPSGYFTFDDVPGNFWYANYVNEACVYGLMKGVSSTHFAPNKAIKRADFVTVLGRLHEQVASDIPDAKWCSFDDTVDNAYYSKYVDWAVDAEIVKGFGNNKFKPNDPITREQMAVVLYRYIEYAGIEITIDEPTIIIIIKFNDSDDISSWAFSAIGRLQGYGLINGDENVCFWPQKDLTRAEAAKVYVKLHDLIFKPGIYFLEQ
ncbi:MAG: S-layer homology domain-containing protein [Bacillota bacterium]|jgi:hypothetical protein